MTYTTAFEGKNRIMKKFRRILIGIAFGAAVFFPRYALAFETPNPAQDLRAPVDIINHTSAPIKESALPIYAFADTRSVVDSPSVITKTSVIPATTPSRTRFAGPITLPTSAAPLVMEGEASYYSRAGCLGCNPLFVMANGQVLDDNALTMAIGADKVHLVGHTARVTSLATGKSVNVRITDTGGFYKDKYGNRVADLTIATKEAIGMRGGVGQVRVEVY